MWEFKDNFFTQVNHDLAEKMKIFSSKGVVFPIRIGYIECQARVVVANDDYFRMVLQNDNEYYVRYREVKELDFDIFLISFSYRSMKIVIPQPQEQKWTQKQ